MTEQSPSTWTIGRSRDCDVVVDDAAIEGKHCQIHFEGGTWSIVPIRGPVGIQTLDQHTVKWSRDRLPVTALDTVWLTPDLKLPWPSDLEARACLTVGRAADSDINVPSSHVSGRHALLIAGPNGTWVLRDLDSRNGLFIDADLKQRVTAVMLLPGQSVYFGSERIDSNVLVAKAKKICPPVMSPSLRSAKEAKEVNQMTDSAAANLKVKSTARRPMASAMKTLLSVLVPPVATIAFWFVFMRPATDAVDFSQKTPSEEPVLTVPVPAEVTAVPEQPAPMADNSLKQSPPSDALYWILVRHDETGNYYRLGSAVAVSSGKLLTTASVVTAMQGMATDGYSTPSVVQVTTGQITKITSHHVFPEFLARTQKANALVAQYEKLIASVGEDAAKVAGSRDEMNSKAELVNVAMSATAAVDLGWVICESTPAFLEVDPSVNYRPAQNLTCLSAGFDAEDPFFIAPSSATPRTMNLRVKSVGAELGGFDGVITLEMAGQSPEAQNLIGSPLVLADRVVGMIVFQDFESRTIEAVAASVISKVLTEEKR
jgi:predicted component of type VI protein secretion system